MPIVRPTYDIAPGTPVEALDTPVLLLDLDIFERNGRRMMDVMKAHGVGWRPHSKAIKSAELVKLQMAIGAHGATCAKVSEAEVLVAGGVPSVLIAYELAQPLKWERVAALQEHAEVIACVDAPEHVRMASEAGLKAGVDVPVLVELDIGMDRCGIEPGAPAVDLAKLVMDTKGVRLAGIMGYEGHLLTAWPMADKEAQVRESVGRLTATADAIRAAGMPCEIVSSGGSGSYMVTATVPGVTELQAGGGCLMDRFYAEQCHMTELGFEFAVTILASVAGRPKHAPERAILDGGFKTMSDSMALPLPIDLPDTEVAYLSAEHMNLKVGPDAPPLRIGDKVRFIPEYTDTTTFRHDAFVAIRNGVVESVIPLAARGRLT
ncbi:MAG: DSD1 family PLP-dependent enzyme [Chloroflexota bacterium]